MGVLFNHSLRQMGLLGVKVGMSQNFDENGNMMPVTLIQLGPCVVVQKKDKDKDGYAALQLGFGEIRESIVRAPVLGHYKKNNLPVKRYLKEFKGFNTENYTIGDVIKADLFAINDLVDIAGISKGKGFAGVHKRHNFGGGRKTHGSNFHRRPGSIGANSTPSKVIKGMRMPGHMGANKVTTRHLKVVTVDLENNLIVVKGSVPGPNNGIVAVMKKGENI